MVVHTFNLSTWEVEAETRKGRGEKRKREKRRERKERMVCVHACNPRTQEAERRQAGRSPLGSPAKPEARPCLKNKHTKANSVFTTGTLYLVGVWRMCDSGCTEPPPAFLFLPQAGTPQQHKQGRFLPSPRLPWTFLTRL